MTDDVLERERQLLSQADPAARAVLAATNADAAFEALYAWSRDELRSELALGTLRPTRSATRGTR